jgi:hypothetical protein
MGTRGVQTPLIPGEPDHSTLVMVWKGLGQVPCGSESAFHKLADELIGLGGVHA